MDSRYKQRHGKEVEEETGSDFGSFDGSYPSLTEKPTIPSQIYPGDFETLFDPVDGPLSPINDITVGRIKHYIFQGATSVDIQEMRNGYCVISNFGSSSLPIDSVEDLQVPEGYLPLIKPKGVCLLHRTGRGTYYGDLYFLSGDLVKEVDFLEKTDKIKNLKVVTQAEYDAIATPDPETLYFIQ